MNAHKINAGCWLGFVLAFALCLVPSLADAQDQDTTQETLFGDRFSVKIGYRMWVASWTAPPNLGFGSTNSASNLQSKGPSVFSGPAFSGSMRLNDGDWFQALIVSGTWLHGGFDFNNTITRGEITTFPPLTTLTTTDTSKNSALRTDYTVTLGLAVWKGFGIFAGYYSNREKFQTNVTSILDSTGQQIVSGNFTNVTRTISGPIFGLFGNAELSERVSMYGNWSYGLFDISSENCAAINCVDTKSSQGQSVELGVNVAGPRIWKATTEFQIGYRLQYIRATQGPSQGPFAEPAGGNRYISDTTYGPTFMISAAF